MAAAAQTPRPPFDELELPAELVSEIERDAAGALRQARYLEELPLDGVPPAIVFRP